MSRSRQRTPITGNCVCRSEKDEKRIANRKLRRKTREALRIDDDPFPPAGHARGLERMALGQRRQVLARLLANRSAIRKSTVEVVW